MRIIDLLVEEKERVQQQLAKEAGDDTEKYFAYSPTGIGCARTTRIEI